MWTKKNEKSDFLIFSSGNAHFFFFLPLKNTGVFCGPGYGPTLASGPTGAGTRAKKSSGGHGPAGAGGKKFSRGQKCMKECLSRRGELKSDAFYRAFPAKSQWIFIFE